MMFELGGKTWHRGTLVLKTNQGERTITHLQSLALPAAHYYYNRRLSDNEAVGIVSGQKGFEPKALPGYAGQVSEVEALCPAWADLKRGLIQAHLRWGEVSRGAEDARRGTLRGGAGEQGGEQVHPLDGVQAQVNLGGQDYPVLVRRLVAGPGGRRLAEATYYDDRARAWKVVDDEAARTRLAEQVQAGQLEPWETGEMAE
jgi:hypothetical protein